MSTIKLLRGFDVMYRTSYRKLNNEVVIRIPLKIIQSLFAFNKEALAFPKRKGKSRPQSFISLFLIYSETNNAKRY